ncbi:MAG: HAD family phosphatase [Oscillospiraceae bacterium]|nr:HAD family phosphatase [Oscillospiraceae bacterium]
MAIQGAIFDMDGTLLDSMHLWRGWDVRYLQTLGITPTPEQSEKMTGMMLEELGEYIPKTFHLALTPKEVIDGVNRMQEPGYFHEVTVKPTVRATLEKLRRRGVPMVLATATERYLTEGALDRLDLAKYFLKIFTCHEMHKSKYEPDIFLAAGAFLGTPKESTWVFEDTWYSIQGALKAGYPVVAVEDRWSAHNRDKIRAHADRYVVHLGDLDLDTL